MPDLSSLKVRVIAVIDDLATLEVATVTGSVDLSTTTDAATIFQAITTALPQSTLVGYSKFEVDGDAVNYVNSDLGEGKKYLLDGHAALVEGAQKSRKDLFDFVLKVINSVK